MPNGIIIKGIGGFYYVKTEAGIYECKARGVFRKNALSPLPGDRVEISILDEDKKLGSLDVILPRQNELIRPAVSNISQAVMVLAAKSPVPDLFLLDKLLIYCQSKEIKAVICVNKIDLDTNEDSQNICRAYTLAGYKIIATSAKTNCGIEELRGHLKDNVSALAGQSGVGKSTLLNLIMERRVMETGAVSEKIERGKHTTRHTELVELEQGGLILDTPGFSSMELQEIEHSKLELYYPEFEPFYNCCRFTGCSHIAEPDCSVKKAVEEGIIDKGRYQRYTEFYQTLKQKPKY